jgi:hypothetical protein
VIGTFDFPFLASITSRLTPPPPLLAREVVGAKRTGAPVNRERLYALAEQNRVNTTASFAIVALKEMLPIKTLQTTHR